MTEGVLSLDEAKRRVLVLGGTVEQIHGTGEIKFNHWLALHPQRVSANRKDASRALMWWIRKLERARAALVSELSENGALEETTH